MKKTIIIIVAFLSALVLIFCIHSFAKHSNHKKPISNHSKEINKNHSTAKQKKNIHSIAGTLPKVTKTAYLTFDDGPSKNTSKILDILKAYQVKGTFFVIGNETPEGIEMYKRIVKEGHSIGNHTYSHKYNVIYSSPIGFFDDFYRLENLLYKTIGFKPNLVRFPGGSNNHVSYQYGGTRVTTDIAILLNAKGYIYVDWNIDSMDSAKVVQDRDVIINTVLGTTQDRKDIIILMHDANIKTTTVEALPYIIEGLKKQGYSFAPLTTTSFNRQFLVPPAN